MAINLSNVSFAYYYPKKKEPKLVLKDINLEIAPNDEMITILGHTGSGKSTLVQLFNGLLQTNDGVVEVFDNKVSAKRNRNLNKIRKKVGLVFQFPEYQVFEETVLKDVMFGPKNFGLKEDLELAKKALSQVGLGEEFYEKSPFTLSGGELRRVAIAGVLAFNPDILVLDEPTVGLDPLGKKELLCMLEKLNKEYHKTVILITHDMEVVSHIAKRVIVLAKGNIVFDGSKDSLFKNDKIISQYGLSYPNSIKILKAIKERFNLDLDIYQYNIDDCYQELRRVVGSNE